METTSLRLFLQSLCHNSPWNYAVFWKLQHGPHMLLVWEDGYYDVGRPRACMKNLTGNAYCKSSDEFLSSSCELGRCMESLGGCSIGPAMAEMSTTYYAIGEGVVGEAAYIGVPRWAFSDYIANDGFSPSLVSQCADEWLSQFAAGIKTILLIPSMPYGVLQLGSFETVAEDEELVANIKDKFVADQKFAEYTSSFWLSVEDQSSVMMSALAENLDESSANMRSNISEDPKAISNFRANEDELPNTNKTSRIIPVSCHIFERDMPQVQEFETGRKEDMQLMNEVDAVAPFNHQHFEQDKSEIRKRKPGRSLFLHEMGVLSSSNNINARVFEDYANEMIDFYLDGGAMEPPLTGDFDSTINRSTGNFLSFPRDCELHKALGPDIMDHSIQYMWGSSDSVGVVASSSVYSKDSNHCMEPLSWDSGGCFLRGNDEDSLLEAVFTNASSISDYSSSNLSIYASPFNPRGRFVSDSERHSHFGRSGMVGEDSGPWSCVTSAAGYGKALTNSSPSTTSYNPMASASIVDQPQEKGYNFLHHRKKSNLSSVNKIRARPGDNQKTKPRDRQLIQDRIKELRELVPNGAKCSIDGLLDKTIKHMVFLQSSTDRADKLRQQVVKQVSERTRPNLPLVKENGTSWAVDLANEKQMCPIIVKDLEFPRQMLIEMVCDDYGRFLEIADVIHRLELTILRGVMENRSDCTWAHFTVEATGSFHRLDLFWPLMQLLQQNKLPIPSKI